MSATPEQLEMDLVPPAVRRKIEEMSKFTAPDPNDAGNPAPDAGTPPPAEPAPAPVPPVEPPKPPEEPAAPASAAPAVTSTPPAEPPKTLAELATPEMTTEQRYKIMEGLQKAIGRDLSRAQREASALREEVAALKAQLAAAPTAAPAPGAPPSHAQQDKSQLETRLKESLGAANVADMVEYLRQQGFAVTQDLKSIESRVGTVVDSVHMSATERFNTEMDQLTNGKWRQINVEPGFRDFLAEEDGYTGRSKHEGAMHFLQTHDAPRLARYFADYMAKTASGAPAAAPAAPAGPKLDLKKLASPAATPAGNNPLADERPMVRASEFKKFDADVRAGKYYSNDPAEHAKLQKAMAAEQARLDEAHRSNRVVAG